MSEFVCALSQEGMKEHRRHRTREIKDPTLEEGKGNCQDDDKGKS